jgi:hypothetical protein
VLVISSPAVHAELLALLARAPDALPPALLDQVRDPRHLFPQLDGYHC